MSRSPTKSLTPKSGARKLTESRLSHAPVSSQGQSSMYGRQVESEEGRRKRQNALSQLTDEQSDAFFSPPMASEALERCFNILAPRPGGEVNVGDFCRGLQVFGNPFTIDEVEAFKSLMDVSSVDDSFSFYDLLAKRTEMFDENDIEEGVQQTGAEERRIGQAGSKASQGAKRTQTNSMLNQLHNDGEAEVKATKNSLTKEQVVEFREAFHIFDVDGNGTVTTEELGEVMESLGHHMSEAELQLMIDDVDKDHTGTMNFEEFLELMASRLNSQDTQEELKDAFKTFDIDGNGYIEADELVRVVTSMGERLSLEEAGAMLAEADANSDGKIDYEEFCTVMLG